ncbi:MAG: hypothetical protein AAFQ29_12375, partial [Pseudomonadota bacterium]
TADAARGLPYSIIKLNLKLINDQPSEQEPCISAAFAPKLLFSRAIGCDLRARNKKNAREGAFLSSVAGVDITPGAP